MLETTPAGRTVIETTPPDLLFFETTQVWDGGLSTIADSYFMTTKPDMGELLDCECFCSLKYFSRCSLRHGCADDTPTDFRNAIRRD